MNNKLRFLNGKKISLTLVLVVFFLTMTSTLNMTAATTNNTSSPQGITLNILTRHSSEIFVTYKTAFLASDLATQAGVTNVVFYQQSEANWPITAKTGIIDLGWGGGPTLFDNLIKLDLADTINGTDVMNEISNIPDDIAGAPMKRYDGTGEDLLWIGAAISSFGFTINKDVLAAKGLDYPTTWTQLIRPEYFAQVSPLIAMGNSPDTTSNTRIYEIIIQKFGWDLGWGVLTAMAGNSVIKHGSTEVLIAVTGGEVGIGMTIDFYGYGAQLSNPACEYIIPSEQSIVNADPICLIKGGNPTNREAANAFMEFVLSKEGQSIWLSSNINRIPVREDAFETTIGQQRTDLYDAYVTTINNVGITFNDTESSTYHGTLLYYFQATLTDAHSKLNDAWGSIVASWKNSGTENLPRIQDYNLTSWIKNLGAPLLDIETARSISEAIEEGGTPRTEQMAIWTAEANVRYAAIEAAALISNEMEDSTSPQISSVQVSDFDNETATITWTTDEDAITTVNYGLTTDLGSTYTNEDRITSFSELPMKDHVAKLTNLTSGGTYYFEVSSTDISGNSQIDDNSGDYYTFTLIDTAPPEISSVTVTPQNDSALVSWTTDELSDSRVNYGNTTSLDESVYDATEVFVHETTIQDLEPLTTYYFEINSSDGIFFTIDNNLTSFYSFTTLETRDEIAPTVSSLEVDTTDTTATISFVTDEPSRVFLYYGIGTPTESVEIAVLATTHEVTLEGLAANTVYSYYFDISDAFNNAKRHPEGTSYLSFTTEETPTTTTTTTTTTTSRTAIPGFEINGVVLALQALIICIVYKRKKK